eukprot:GHVU01067290.1.p1 GENE.GHVU01067290.1~~GHVU01067290.1.p1  ORF type:complete len:110 (+),score=17.39 GHVU01067290.1:174-503(+)
MHAAPMMRGGGMRQGVCVCVCVRPANTAWRLTSMSGHRPGKRRGTDGLAWVGAWLWMDGCKQQQQLLLRLGGAAAASCAWVLGSPSPGCRQLGPEKERQAQLGANCFAG